MAATVWVAVVAMSILACELALALACCRDCAMLVAEDSEQNKSKAAARKAAKGLAAAQGSAMFPLKRLLDFKNRCAADVWRDASQSALQLAAALKPRRRSQKAPCRPLDDDDEAALEIFMDPRLLEARHSSLRMALSCVLRPAGTTTVSS